MRAFCRLIFFYSTLASPLQPPLRSPVAQIRNKETHLYSINRHSGRTFVSCDEFLAKQVPVRGSTITRADISVTPGAADVTNAARPLESMVLGRQRMKTYY
jgi:hypothetical protein